MPFLRDRHQDVLSRREALIIGLIFHAYYQDRIGVFAVDDIELIGGSLPSRQERLVTAWAEIHQAELLDNWKALQAGHPPAKIKPLR